MTSGTAAFTSKGSNQTTVINIVEDRMVSHLI